MPNSGRKEGLTSLLPGALIYPLPEVSSDQFYFLMLSGFFISLVMLSVMACLVLQI